MNTFNRRDFVAGTTALGLVLASRTGFAASRNHLTIYVEADPPQSTPVLGNSQISGDVSLMVQIALPCGGAWQ